MLKISQDKQQDSGSFWGVLSIVAGLFFTVLVANVVSINWQTSAGLYCLLIGICAWSLLRFAMPHASGPRKVVAALVVIMIMGLLGFYGTLNQYRRQHDSPHLRAHQVMMMLPLVPGRPLTFVVNIENSGSAGSLLFKSGTIILDHLISEGNRHEAEAMVFGTTTMGLDNQAELKPTLDFDAGEIQSWTFTGATVTPEMIQQLSNGGIQYFDGKGRYVGRPDLPPFELCFYWPHGYASASVKCETHNSPW